MTISLSKLRPLPLVTLTALLALPAGAQKLVLDSGSAAIDGSGTQVTGGSMATFSGGAGPATSAYAEVNANNYPNLPNSESLAVGTGASISKLNCIGATITITGGTIENAFGDANNTFNIQGGNITQITNGDFGGRANISGGNVGRVDNEDSSSTFITGGTVGQAYADNYGGVFISGGTVTTVVSDGFGEASVTGGAVADAVAGDGASLFISGGSVQKVEADSRSFVTITGGTVHEIDLGNEGYARISGGSFQFINNVFGGAYLTGTNLKAIQTTGTGDVNVFLTGTLTNGDTLSAFYTGPADSPYDLEKGLFFNGQRAAISAAPVPEASTVVSFGLPLGLGGMALKRRRHKTVTEV